MKKILAIACVLCFAFATLTAFAAPTVTTTTNYDYEQPNAEMTIKTIIGGLDLGGEITYYVANEENGDIVYIDQATAEGTAATFEFKAATGDVLAATAKNGSDQGYEFPTFVFNEGCNFLTEGTATLTETPDAWGVYSEAQEGYIFQGQISGAVKAYGVEITIDGVKCELQAMGCSEDGTFAVVLQGISEEELATAKQFVK